LYEEIIDRHPHQHLRISSQSADNAAKGCLKVIEQVFVEEFDVNYHHVGINPQIRV
jgi:hypothetical protein